MGEMRLMAEVLAEPEIVEVRAAWFVGRRERGGLEEDRVDRCAQLSLGVAPLSEAQNL